MKSHAEAQSLSHRRYRMFKRRIGAQNAPIDEERFRVAGCARTLWLCASAFSLDAQLISLLGAVEAAVRRESARIEDETAHVEGLAREERVIGQIVQDAAARTPLEPRQRHVGRE